MFRKESIAARFIGKTSCGFVHGEIYHVDIRVYRNKIWILDTRSKACCPYDGIENVARNWDTSATQKQTK